MWPRLKDIIGFKITVFRGVIFFLGGKQFESGNITNLCISYDPTNNIWLRRRPMLSTRIRFSVEVYDNYIYVTGGENRHGHIITHCETYDPLTDSWSAFKPLPKPRADHASCIVGDQLYVSGGVSERGKIATNSFWKYDFKMDHWIQAGGESVLPSERERHSMISYKGIIYIVGGIGFDFDKKNKTVKEHQHDTIISFQCTGERAKIFGSWYQNYPKMQNGRAMHSLALLGHNLYVIGGHDYERSVNIPFMIYFNLRKKKWCESFTIIGDGLLSAQSCLVTVPRSNKEFNSLSQLLSDKWILW